MFYKRPPTVVQRKLEAELGKNAPEKDYIIAAFQRFCETDTIENQECSKRPSKITVNEVHNINENQQQTSVQIVCNGLLYFSNNTTSNYDCISFTKLNLFKNLMKKAYKIELKCIKS